MVVASRSLDCLSFGFRDPSEGVKLLFQKLCFYCYRILGIKKRGGIGCMLSLFAHSAFKTILHLRGANFTSFHTGLSQVPLTV